MPLPCTQGICSHLWIQVPEIQSLLLGVLVCLFKTKQKTQRPPLEPLNQNLLDGSWEFPGDSNMGGPNSHLCDQLP